MRRVWVREGCGMEMMVAGLDEGCPSTLVDA